MNYELAMKALSENSTESIKKALYFFHESVEKDKRSIDSISNIPTKLLSTLQLGVLYCSLKDPKAFKYTMLFIDTGMHNSIAYRTIAKCYDIGIGCIRNKELVDKYNKLGDKFDSS